MRCKMKVLLEKTITMDKVYQVKALPPKKNSKYKYRLYVNGLAKTLYENLDDAINDISIMLNLNGKNKWVQSQYEPEVYRWINQQGNK